MKETNNMLVDEIIKEIFITIVCVNVQDVEIKFQNIKIDEHILFSIVIIMNEYTCLLTGKLSNNLFFTFFWDLNDVMICRLRS
jgi:hypothetical protein